MCEKLENRKRVLESLSMCSKFVQEDAKRQEKKLSVEVESLLVAGIALSIARKQLQVIFNLYLLRYPILVGFYRVENLVNFVDI